MKIEGYIAKNIKIGIYEPDTEADIDELIAEIQSRRRQLGTPSFFRRFRERWQMLKNKQTRL